MSCWERAPRQRSRPSPTSSMRAAAALVTPSVTSPRMTTAPRWWRRRCRGSGASTPSSTAPLSTLCSAGWARPATSRTGGAPSAAKTSARFRWHGLARAPCDFADWRATFDVNIFGSLQMTRAALDALRVNGGAVVFVSSQTQHHPPPLAPQMAYAASKSALTGAMHHLAQEVGPAGVRVNEVTPSWMWGPPVEGFVNMTAKQRGVEPDVVLQEITGNFPLRRMVTDGEVAEVIAFLASDRAAGITGQTLFVNAGEIMH